MEVVVEVEVVETAGAVEEVVDWVAKKVVDRDCVAVVDARKVE